MVVKIKEAMYYKKLRNEIVQCQLCPRFCTLDEDEYGKCKARKNIKGKLVSLSYGHPVAVHVDPLLKKPIYHMLPGTNSFSIGTAGCSLNCLHCQNYEISQRGPEEIPTPYVSPEKIIDLVQENDCPSISYTYTEPVVMYEYMLDIAKLARKKRIKNVIVTNGYINQEPLKELCKYIDAANVDLKGYSEEFYKKICIGGHLKPVLEAMKTMKRLGVWVEVTNLIIPGYNDDIEKIEEMAKWIKENLGKETPLHLSRFFPHYKLLEVEPTPEETLRKAYEMAKKHLEHVYLGNLLVDKEDNTYCPKCGELLIERRGFRVLENKVEKGKCGFCQEKIEGIWE